jgi:hypothetical protein
LNAKVRDELLRSANVIRLTDFYGFWHRLRVCVAVDLHVGEIAGLVSEENEFKAFAGRL